MTVTQKQEAFKMYHTDIITKWDKEHNVNRLIYRIIKSYNGISYTKLNTCVCSVIKLSNVDINKSLKILFDIEYIVKENNYYKAIK